MSERPHAIVDHITASYAFGTWKHVMIWVVEGHTPLAGLEAFRRRLAALARERNNEQHVALTILYPTDSTMSAEERRSVARMIDETKHLRLASSTAVLARGLMGAVHRSILTGLSILVPPPHPNKITATIEDAIDFVYPWVTQSCGPVLRSDLRAMIGDLHDALYARRGAVPPGV